jgi:hypothetical protein
MVKLDTQTARKERHVSDASTYYAVYDNYGRDPEPWTVFRRTNAEVRADEIFAYDLAWKWSSSLIEAEHGDLMYDFIKIDAGAAQLIMAFVRARAAMRDDLRQVADRLIAVVPDPMPPVLPREFGLS